MGWDYDRRPDIDDWIVLDSDQRKRVLAMPDLQATHGHTYAYTSFSLGGPSGPHMHAAMIAIKWGLFSGRNSVKKRFWKGKTALL